MCSMAVYSDAAGRGDADDGKAPTRMQCSGMRDKKGAPSWGARIASTLRQGCLPPRERRFLKTTAGSRRRATLRSGVTMLFGSTWGRWTASVSRCRGEGGHNRHKVASNASQKTEEQSRCLPFADFNGVSSSFFHNPAMPTLRLCSCARGGVLH